jgi:RND family efflux transporter MFP subunit
MIIVLLIVYIALLFLMVKLDFIRWNLFWKTSPLLVFIALNIGLFIPMGWGAPQGPALVMRHSVQIVPNVAGEVVDVPVAPNTALKAGDVLFRIDPAPFLSKVHLLEAQLRFAELRYKQFSTLQQKQAGRGFDVEQHKSDVEAYKAQLEAARWDLEKTTVRAPADGYVTNLALRKGARVSAMPLSAVMAFIDTSDTWVGVEVAQNKARYIEPGQHVEITFKFLPGKVHTGRVETVLQAISSGQVKPSGFAVTPPDVEAAPFAVRVRLDNGALTERLPAGAAGTAAIFTEHVKVTHVIRRVMLRMTAILNYINPF